MISKELRELIFLSVEPELFDASKRAVIYQRADAEGTPRREVDIVLNQLLGKKYDKAFIPSNDTGIPFQKKYFFKRVIVNGSRYLMKNISCDGEEIKAWRKHKYFFFGRPVEVTIPVQDITYFDIFKKIGFRKRAEFGSLDNQWSIRFKKGVAGHLKNTCISHLARFCWTDVSIIKAHVTKEHSVTQPRLWVSNDYIIHSHNCLLGTESRIFVKITDVAFYCKNRGVKDIDIYFGYQDQIDIDGISSKIATALEAHCKKHGAKIGEEQMNVFKPSFSIMKYLNPVNWFRKEQIVLNDHAIIYYCKGLLSTDCTYLPYEDVKVARFGWGFLGKSVNLFGIQNVLSYRKYSRNNCIKPLKQALDEHGIQTAGVKVRYSWPWFRFLGADVVGITYDGLCLSAHEYKGEGIYGRRRSYYVPYEDIYHFDKFWWWLFWRTYYVKARVRNLRKDQEDQDLSLKFRRMIFWCGLFRALSSTSAQQSDFYHKLCKDDYKLFK